MTQPTPASVSPPRSSPRIDTIDYAKGVGILLVVLGHTWRGLDGRITLPQPAFDAMDRWVYGFHMPLFFFVSGLFLFRSAAKPAGTYLLDKVSTLLWPYLLWSVIYWRLGSLAGGEKLGPAAFAVTLVTRTIGHLWFLWVLFWIAVVMLALRKARVPAIGVLGLALAFYAVARAGWLAPLPDAIESRAYSFAMFFPYVALAAVVAGPLLPALAGTRLRTWAGLAVIGAAVVTLAVQTNSLPNDAQMFNPVSGIAGIAMTIGVARVLERDRINSVAFLGRRSLEIYLVHVLAAAATRVVLLKLGVVQWFVHLPLGFAAGVLGPLALWYACKLIRFPYLFRLTGEKKHQILPGSSDKP